FRTFDNYRTSSSRSIWLSQFHTHTLDCFHPAVFIWNDFYRVCKKVKNHTLFFCMVNFFSSGRKFFFASSVYDMYLCTQTQSCCGSVHSNVSAAYYHNSLSCLDRCIVILTESSHQIASCKVFVCREDSIAYFPRNSHKHTK